MSAASALCAWVLLALLKFAASTCQSWCHFDFATHCKQLDQCGSCAGCLNGEPTDATRPELLMTAECKSWCHFNWFKHCADIGQCGGCAECYASPPQPMPPPSPLPPGRSSANPFAQPAGGYYVLPQYARAVNGTIALASQAHASARELQALRRMSQAPIAFWLDTKVPFHQLGFTVRASLPEN